jgi:GNAT domain-containint protein/N-acyltransferase family protein
VPNPNDVAARLALPAEADAWVRELDGGTPPEPRLPPRSDAPALLDRLAVRPDDAAEILAGWPSGAWPAELRWLLGKVVAAVRADLGGAGWLVPGPSLPRDRGPAWRHFYVYAYLALLDDVRGYHALHGVPDDVSWTTLADLGRNLAVDRRMGGDGWPIMLQWLTLHVRGAIYELGRLQFHRRETAGSTALSLHIPRSGPLTPEACDASFARAREFFPRHFPDEPYHEITCTSWLLDPALADYLPADSNIVRFQRRFELRPGGTDGVLDFVYFVFGTRSTPLEELTPRTALQRAGLAHLRAGGRWHNRTGRIALDRPGQ